jgi:cyclopropane fatty-acyl-phospholipid synthase-like methyltransferase
MQSIYQDGTYLENSPNWHEEDSSWKADHIIQMIHKNNLNPSTLCEIGCGAGEILCQLSEHLSETVEIRGYEISSQAFNICKYKSKKNLNFFLEDVLQNDEEFFDIVMAIDVFEHVEDYFSFLRTLKSKAKYKIFHIPLDLSAQAALRPSSFTRVRKLIGHLHYFTKETALATLEDTGYNILDWHYTCGAVELSSYRWQGGFMKLPRRLLFTLNPDLAAKALGGFSLLVLAE